MNKKLNVKRERERRLYVWPDLVIMEFLTAVALTTILIVWALFVNAPLLEIATPGISENPSKAPWYFVGLQELLVYFDPWISGVIIPCIIISSLILIPYIDNNPLGSGRYSFGIRRIALLHFNIGFFMWLALMFIGYFMRGPNWQLYMPWESWDVIKITEKSLRNLRPAEGTAAIIVYFTAGVIIPRIVGRRFYRECGTVRYLLVMTLMLLMYAVPIKIFLRLVFDIRYVLVTPWFNI